MKVVNCTKCNEEYAIDLNKPEEWYCPYCDNLYSITTDKLSVEKLQEIRVEELKDFNSKILQAELKNQKLQKEIDAAKKYIEESYKADKEDNKLLDLIIEAVAKLKSDNETLKNALTESEKMYQKQMDRFLNSEMNESARSHCESQLKLLFPAHKAYEALAAIGSEGSGDE